MSVDTVIWPPQLALVDQVKGTAYAMRFLKKAFVVGKVEVKPLAVPQGLLAMEPLYSCQKEEAFYLAGIHLRPLEGKRVPKGSLSMMMDGEVAVEGKISSFLPDPEPLDCMRVRRWKKTDQLLPAVVVMGSDEKPEADPRHQIGFMLPNDTAVQIYLSDLVVEEAVPLEITLLSALYTTKKGK